MRLTLLTARNIHRAALISGLTLFGALLACGSSSDGPTTPGPDPGPVVPALESVPFGLLGSGKVAFERIGANGAYEAIYVIDATAISSAHAFDNAVTWGPTLSPDGRRLAYTKFTDGTTAYDVYVANTDGTGVNHVTRFTGQEGPPTWTPDGAKIVVAGRASSDLVLNVYSQSAVANPGDVQRLTNFTASPGVPLVCPTIILNDVRVAISAQGVLAFACSPGEIDVLSSNGTLSASYVASRADRRRWPAAFSPSWSPDGTRLAFVEIATDSDTNYSLVGFAVRIMNADASNVTTVATVPASKPSGAGGGWNGLNNFSLCWMPDGSRLVFNVPESDLVGHIWVVRVDGTGLAQLTSAAAAWDRSVSCSR